jgi:hypothetical protein
MRCHEQDVDPRNALLGLENKRLLGSAEQN